MDMKSYCLEHNNAEPALIDVPVVYLPCPQRHYKSKVINRATLSHEQYIDLLSTPKGFMWSKHTGLATPVKKKRRSVRKRRVDNGIGIKAPLSTTDYRYLRDFITDVWNVMTPEYEKKLQKILMNEYGMSESQAKEFLDEQKLRSAFSQRKPHTRINLSARHEWVKEIADVLSGKLTDYLSGMLATRRTKRVRFTADAILNSLGEITGEKCTLGEPQNRVQSAQVFAADRLAIWLSNIFGDHDQELCRQILKVTDDAERDSEASSEYESESESIYENAAEENKGQTPAGETGSEKGGGTSLEEKAPEPTVAKENIEDTIQKEPPETTPQQIPSEDNLQKETSVTKSQGDDPPVEADSPEPSPQTELPETETEPDDNAMPGQENT